MTLDPPGITLTLSYVPPYDWPAVAAFFAARAVPGVECVEPDRYRRTIELGGRQGTIEVAPLRGRHALAATIRFADLEALPSIAGRLRRMFDLASDIGAITAHLAKDPRLASLVAARPGLRVPGAWDGFELAVRAVLGQQVTVTAARQLAGRLVATCGARMAAPHEGLTAVFPRPERLAGADLSTLGMPRARGRAGSAGRDSRRRARALRARGRPGSPPGPPARAPRHRRMDGAVHRPARAAGAGRVSCLGRGAAARDDGCRRPAAVPRRPSGARRGVAPLARLRRPAPVGGRRRLDGVAKGDRGMSASVDRLIAERVASPIGTLLVVCDAAGVLRALDLHDDEKETGRVLDRHCPGGYSLEHGRVASRVTDALAAYFAGEVRAIDALPVHTGGSEFQRRVWAALREIPAGTTTSYGRLAAAIGRPGASRAVGLANGSNPIAIVVPCHRVIGADKTLTGYGGGLERKRWLLDHELRWCAPLFAGRERPA